MKKTIAVFLILCFAAALAACGANDLYIHDPASGAEPPAAKDTPEPVLTEPDPVVAEALGGQVILSVKNEMQSFAAPDGSGKTILSFGTDTVKVVLDDRAAAEKINQFLAMKDEMYYTGSGAGDGMYELLELATDNYTLVKELGTSQNTEFSCTRSVIVERGDSRILSLRYRVNSYTGGAHGLYADRVFVFDTATGSLLKLDDIAADRAALEEAMLAKMTDLIENDVRYQPVKEYMKAFQPDLELNDALRSLFREGSWLLDDEGFAVFSDLYEIGSYADGILRFSLSYEELDGILREEYLPFARSESGELFIRSIDSPRSASVILVDKVTTDEKGSEFRVFSQGTVYDVSIDSVVYISDHVGFYQTTTHWYCSYLSNAGVQVQTLIPDGMPDLMIRYLDENGQPHSFLITRSGEDGTVILLEEEHVEAVG